MSVGIVIAFSDVGRPGEGEQRDAVAGVIFSDGYAFLYVGEFDFHIFLEFVELRFDYHVGCGFVENECADL